MASFAFNTGAPVQGKGGLSGQSQGPRVVGSGGSTSGVVNATPQTVAQAGQASTIPAFLEKLVEPAIAARQQQRMFEGYAAAMSAQATGEMLKSKSGISEIFGPTNFEQGAAFYNSQAIVSKTMSSLNDDMDNLKKLSPPDLAKHVADISTKAMTGDKFADQAIQLSLMEQTGPFLQTAAKARFAWQQDTTYASALDAAGSSSKNLQGIMSQLSTVTAPSDEQTSAAKMSVNTFLKSRAKIEGMTDGTYKRFLASSLRNDIDEGNGFAVEAMRQSGVMNVLQELDPDAADKLEERYRTKGMRVQKEAAMSEVAPMAAIEIKIRRMRLGDPTITPMEIANDYMAINGRITGKTGFTQPLFDYEAIKGGVTSAVDAIYTADLKEQTRQEAAVERSKDLQDKKDFEEWKAGAVAARTRLAYGSGNLNAAIATGAADRNVADAIVGQDIQAGNFGPVIQAFSSDLFVSEQGKRVLQAPFLASEGKGYTNDVGNGIKAFKALQAANPGAARAYFGDQYQNALTISSRIDGGAQPTDAYASVYGNNYGVTAELPYADRKAAPKLVAKEVSRLQPNGFLAMFGGPKQYNQSAQAAISDAIGLEVSLSRKNGSPISLEEDTKGAAHAVFANGRVEAVGAFAWRQQPGTRKLSEAVGVPQEQLDLAFHDLVDERLKAAGIPAGANVQQYKVFRTPDPINGGEHLVMVTPFGDGTEKVVTFTTQDLRARADAQAKGKIAGAAAQRAIGDYILHGSPEQRADKRTFGERYNDAMATDKRYVDQNYDNPIVVKRTQASKTDPGFSVSRRK